MLSLFPKCVALLPAPPEMADTHPELRRSSSISSRVEIDSGLWLLLSFHHAAAISGSNFLQGLEAADVDMF